MGVLVRSSARLHLGIIDLSRSLGRKYGSIGVMTDRPSVEVHAEKSDDIVVRCEQGVEVPPREVRGYINRILKHFRIRNGVKIRVNRDIPRHVGFGSTTQMALSVAAAVTKLYGKTATIRELSSLLGRGRASGIGTIAFERGGFIIDGGVGGGQGPPPAILRMDLPGNWFFLVVVPAIKRGLSGDEEKKILEKLSAPSNYAEKISHLLLMKMLPALFEEDIKRFGDALSEIQVLVGRSFSRFQGGIYHSKVSEDLVRFLLREGACGCGQSSWGPAVYGLVEGIRNGEKLKREVEKFMMKKDIKGSIYLVTANNKGAEIKTVSS